MIACLFELPHLLPSQLYFHLQPTQPQIHKMEPVRSRTTLSTTITTEPCSGEDAISIEALQQKINDLTQQISLLHSKTDELAQIVRREEENEPETTSIAPERPNYKFPTIGTAEEHVHRRGDPSRHPSNEGCNCRCSSLNCAPRILAGGVYLGLVRAGDVAQLGDSMQKELDDGLRAIGIRLFPRGDDGRGSTLDRAREAMITLLQKVSLRQDAVPVAGENYWASYHDPHRGRYQRLAGVRYGYWNRIPEPRLNAYYIETFLQLALFRGIDLDELP
ncbi:hypothetical protein DFP73DRAFT_587556 [Morchella snyderi]|nr:hypothetical protein DFP73DRAFT_587556 [Morchella snyderi]